MISTTRIATIFYQNLINKDVHTLISGKIYKHFSDFNNDLENLEINVINNKNRYIQTGFLNLNLYIKSGANNMPNNDRFDELNALLEPLLRESTYGNVRFQIDSQSGVLIDETHDKLHFINYKFNFQTI